jgi:AraC-like DNA-binding protein
MKTILDLLFILCGTVGLICAYLVALSFKSIRNINIYLALILLGASIRLILRGYLELSNQQDFAWGFLHSNLFFIGLPLPYLYFRNLVWNKSMFEPRDLLHFTLPILLISQPLCHFSSAITLVVIDYAVKYLTLFMLLYYWISTLRVLTRSFWKKTDIIEIKSNQEVLLKKWSMVFFVAFSITGFKLIYYSIIYNNSGLLTDNLLTLLTWMAVFIVILTSPSLLEVYVSQIKPEQLNQSKTPSFWRSKPITEIANPKDLQLNQKIQGELDRYFLQISQFVETEKFFRKSDQTLNDFALKSKIPVSHLSYVFKYHSEVSFSDFRKAVRIQDALALIEEGYLNSNSLDSLSKEVGFYTYNSFYIAFKEVTGNTPQKYVSALTT